MKIRLSKYCDFCFGVKRAVRLIEQTLGNAKEPLYSLGPFIHNPQVVKRFSEKGLKVVRSLRNIKKGILVIRSHGISPDRIEQAGAQGLKLLDTTCPYVKKSQRLVRNFVRRSYKVIIVGDRAHPEVKSLVAQAKGSAIVLSCPQAAEKARLNGKKMGVISQTTQSKNGYLEIISRLLEKDFSEVTICNTICKDVLARQKEAREVARNTEVVLVLGGKISANSRRLAQISRAGGTPTYHIESSSQIKPEWLKNKKSVGIISGASTPKWIVNEAIKKINH